VKRYRPRDRSPSPGTRPGLLVLAASVGGLFYFKPSVRNVAYWHLTDNRTVRAFVRYWTKADNGGFWPAIVCPLMTQSGHQVRNGLSRCDKKIGPHQTTHLSLKGENADRKREIAFTRDPFMFLVMLLMR